MRLILIRHGRQSSPLCNVDVDLSEVGRQQAELLAKRLKGIKPDRIYTSGLIRAKQTAEILFGSDAVFYERDALNEISFGDMTGEADSRNAVLFPEYFAAKKKKEENLRLPGGECPTEVFDRAVPVVEEALVSGVETVVFVTHGGVVRALVAGLLGLGAGQKYALLSNASDPTLIRNDIARRLEAAIGAEYDNLGRFVDLYANGEYLGNYYLCESIAIGHERIAITDLEEQMDRLFQKSNYESVEEYNVDYTHAKIMKEIPEDITGGYLLEREFEDRYKLEYWENPSGFVTDNNEHFFIKSPKYCAVEQVEYLKAYMNEAEEAILSSDSICKATGKSYEDYIDVDSFVKKYLVEEITKNYDGGVSSMYFYKDSDSVDARIKAAPMWDADMSLGCYLEWMEEIAEDPTGLTKLALHPHASPWYEALYEKEDYYQKILKYYHSYAVPYLDELVERGLEAYKEGLSASAAMNDIRWQIDLDNNMYYEDRDTEYEQLEKYITDRKTFLDSVWIK